MTSQDTRTPQAPGRPATGAICQLTEWAENLQLDGSWREFRVEKRKNSGGVQTFVTVKFYIEGDDWYEHRASGDTVELAALAALAFIAAPSNA